VRRFSEKYPGVPRRAGLAHAGCAQNEQEARREGAPVDGDAGRRRLPYAGGAGASRSRVEGCRHPGATPTALSRPVVAARPVGRSVAGRCRRSKRSMVQIEADRDRKVARWRRLLDEGVYGSRAVLARAEGVGRTAVSKAMDGVRHRNRRRCRAWSLPIVAGGDAHLGGRRRRSPRWTGWRWAPPPLRRTPRGGPPGPGGRARPPSRSPPGA
jgi:hypothetical protein